jgi:O-antigen/teichoic acid export membrane protein
LELRSSGLLGTAARVAATRVVSVLLGLVVAVALARLLGVADYGRYSYLLGIAALASVPFQFGLPTLMVRVAAMARLRGSWEEMNGLLAFSALLIVSASVVVFAFVAVAGGVPGARLAIPGSLGVTVVGSLVLLASLAAVAGAAIRGLGHVLESQIPEMVARPVLLLAAVAALHTLEAVSLPATLYANVAAAAAGLGLSALLLRRARVLHLAGGGYAYHSRAWLSSMLPLAFVAAGVQINGQLDVVLLGILMRPEDVGVYRIATLAAVQVSIATWVVNSVLAPSLVEAFKARSRARMAALLRSGTQLALLIGVPVFIGLVVIGRPVLLLLMGPEFLASYTPMLILAVGQLLMLTNGPVGIMLGMCHRERDLARAAAISIATNLILNPVAILTYGVIGAAVATAVSGVVWRVLLARAARATLRSLERDSVARAQ